MTLNFMEIRIRESSVGQYYNFNYYLNVKDLLIIPWIIFLSCLEKVHDNKEFSHENSKPCCESRMEIC